MWLSGGADFIHWKVSIDLDYLYIRQAFRRSLRNHTTTYAEQKDQEDSNHSGSPCPRCRGPCIRVVDEYLYEGIEEIFFKIIKQAAGVVEIFSSWDKWIGACLWLIIRIKTFASWADYTIYQIRIVTYTATSAIERAKKIRTCLAQPGAKYRCLNETLSHSNNMTFKVRSTLYPLS